MTDVVDSRSPQLTDLFKTVLTAMTAVTRQLKGNRMPTELKVKAKTLAYEATAIRKEERKFLGMSRWDRNNNKLPDDNVYRFDKLRVHRTRIVRPEACATHLARAYLSGVPYRVVEASTREPMSRDIRERILRMANTYGDVTFPMTDVEMWIAIPPVKKPMSQADMDATMKRLADR